MSRHQPSKVVAVCRWRGLSNRFFGKYKRFETGAWVKIPGGAFHPRFDTQEKALMFAREWYAQAESAHRQRLATGKPLPNATWDDICDAYLTEVKARMRGKGSTRHEALTVTNASIRRGILATGKPGENDESRCLDWLRALATENIARPGEPLRVRMPMTIRNITKHLRYLFRVALRLKLIPGLTVNPTEGSEFRDEMRALMAKVEPREWLLPRESFSKLVTCSEVPTNRRICYLVLGLTGVRPGELAGLQLRHVQEEKVRYLVIEQQFAQARGKGQHAKIDTPKTKWACRNIPIHRALLKPLDEWITSGWAAWVGRQPQPDDHIFCNWDGMPYRPHDADTFRNDLALAGCPTTFNGEALTPYSFRHLFSTLLTESYAQDAAHTRMMGHRPKDTKTLNYSAKLVTFLATEIEKIPFELPEDVAPFGGPAAARGRPKRGA